MKTVNEVSKLTGISVRTLRYYDEIGLLKPTRVTEAGYRLYDDGALARLEEILFFKELDVSLQGIRDILEEPNYDKEQLLRAQKVLLEYKRNRLNGIIELIEDRLQGGVRKMDFERFNEVDTKRIVEHSLQLQSKESLDAIVRKYGSVEAFSDMVSANLMDENTSKQLIKIYGSKNKAVEASLKADGNQDTLKEWQKDTDEIYRQFSAARDTDDKELTMRLVCRLADNYKAMFHLDNARALLLEMADSYLSGGVLVEATDKQYGEWIAEYIGENIREYYGV